MVMPNEHYALLNEIPERPSRPRLHGGRRLGAALRSSGFRATASTYSWPMARPPSRRSSTRTCTSFRESRRRLQIGATAWGGSQADPRRPRGQRRRHPHRARRPRLRLALPQRATVAEGTGLPWSADVVGDLPRTGGRPPTCDVGGDLPLERLERRLDAARAPGRQAERVPAQALWNSAARTGPLVSWNLTRPAVSMTVMSAIIEIADAEWALRAS
jgi:hypothetical protein